LVCSVDLRNRLIERVNMCKYYVLMYEDGKMRAAETVLRRWGEADKGE
jgi:hypothetical protein